MIHDPEELYAKTLKLLDEQRQARHTQLISLARKSSDPFVSSCALALRDLDEFRDSLIAVWKGQDGTDGTREDD